MARNRSKSFKNRSIKAILKADPNACVISTPDGPWKVLKAQFREITRLAAFIKIADRIAHIRDGWTVVIDSSGFYASRTTRLKAGPSIWTNAQLIEQHAIYATEGRTLTLEERQREAASAYGLQVVFGRAD